MAVYSPSGSGSVHIDILLTQISQQFPLNRDYVGPNLFPQVTVQKQSDKYGIFDRENFKLEAHDVRAPGAVANEIPGLRWSTDTYYANEHALQIAITDEERTNVDAPLQPDIDGTTLVTDRIMLGREAKMHTLATTIANYASGMSADYSGTSTSRWDDYVNSNPIQDFRNANRKINANLFMNANIAIVPWQVMSYLEDHPDFIERIKYSERGIITEEIIAAIVGISNIVVPQVGYSNAGTGVPVTSSTVGYLWGKDVIIAYVPPSAGLRQISFGYEFVWPLGGTQQLVDRWREEQRVSDVVRVRRRYDVKITGYEPTNPNQLLVGFLYHQAVT
jgi:hypothetical protein